MTAEPPTADRVLHDISRGRAGDKVNHPDPAAAPLGTDDEAAGHPPSLEELRIAAASAPSTPPKKTTFGVASFYLAIVIAIAFIVIVILMLR